MQSDAPISARTLGVAPKLSAPLCDLRASALSFLFLFRRPTITFAQGKRKMSLWDPVYKLVKQIPRGRVLSYGAVAKALRLKGGARSAGRAMSATPQGKGIPWHRVLNAAGKIVIREPYSSLQRRLLESEGIEVIENRVRMKTYLWTPPRKKRKPTKEKPRIKRKK
jgi:methylated-DNA-protein-cysteine methyltransferase related protein